MSTATSESTGKTEQVAERLREWNLALDPDVAYDLPSMFPVLDGWGVKGAIKKKHQLIKHLEPTVKRMLRPGEKVLYVARGVQSHLMEQYFMGIWAHMINQTAFVLTNARLLILQINSKGKPKHSFWMIYYSQIQKFKANWVGTLNVKLRDGKSYAFTGFPRADRKAMPQVFEKSLEVYRERGFDPPVTQSRENLCTHCMNRVPKAEYTCGNCGATYWSPAELSLRSLAFPSWGDFLMGHWAFATVELLGYAMLWLGIISVIMGTMENGNLIVGLIISVFLLAMAHLPDATLTFFMGKKGLYPKKGPVAIDAHTDAGAIEV